MKYGPAELRKFMADLKDDEAEVHRMIDASDATVTAKELAHHNTKEIYRQSQVTMLENHLERLGFGR
jgi:hypothetical protein